MASIFSTASLKTLTFQIDNGVDNLLKIRRKRKIDFDSKAHLEPCKFFLKTGECKFGDSCVHKHVTPDSDTVCKHWLRGLCKKNDQCEFLHEYILSKMPSCHFFSTFGTCTNTDCLFLHVQALEVISECPKYKRGFCSKGPNCKLIHTRCALCPDYLAGFCLNGPNCKLAHPKWEIKENEKLQNLPVTSTGVPGANITYVRPDRDIRTDRGDRTHSRVNSNRCRLCQEPGHIAALCPNKNLFEGNDHIVQAEARKLENVTCFRCNQKGHYANLCPNGTSHRNSNFQAQPYPGAIHPGRTMQNPHANPNNMYGGPGPAGAVQNNLNVNFYRPPAPAGNSRWGPQNQ